MDNWQNRTEKLIGKDKVEIINNFNIVLFGLGGVGSYVVEGLVRAGIKNIAIIDKDTIDVTNINRQIIADITTIGKTKVEVEANRIKKISPDANVVSIKEFVNDSNIESIMSEIMAQFLEYSTSASSKIDYVIDAIDTVSSKLAIIEYCYSQNIKLISCMGTGNKLDASKFEITDITKTSVCPLAKVIRKELKNRGIPHLKVLYSKEVPIKTEGTSPASISFVPSVAGLLIAGEVVRELLCYYNSQPKLL